MITATSDSVPTSVETDLSKVPIDKEWSRLAIDDGTKIIKNNEYALRLISRNGEIVTTRSTNLSYRDEVSAAQNPRFDIPPHEDIRNNIEEYLNGSVQFYVSGELAFAGDIIKITTSQKEGDDFTVKTRNPGRRLRDQNVDITPENSILQDTMAKIVDRQNDVRGEYDNHIGSASFNQTTTLGDIVAVADGNTSGTVTFQNIDSDASIIDYIKVKVYTDTTVEFRLLPNDSNEDDVIFTLDGLDKNNFGEWETIQIPELPAVSYDIEFELNGQGLLHDWVVVSGNEVTRNVTAPDINTVGQDEFFYNRSDAELDATLLPNQSKSVKYDSDTGNIRARRAGELYRFDGLYGNVPSSEEGGVQGEAVLLQPGDSLQTTTLTSPDEIEDGGFSVRAKAAGGSGDNYAWSVDLDVGGRSLTDFTLQLEPNEWTWEPIFGSTLNTGTSIDLDLTSRSENTQDVYIDVVWWGHAPTSEHYNDPFFTNTINDEGNLNFPREYVSEAWATFEAQVSPENITQATTTASLINTDSPNFAWGPVQRVTTDIAFDEIPDNSETVTDSYPFAGVDHQVRIYIGSSGFDETQLPSRGYQSIEVEDYEVTVSTNDLEVIFDQNITGNRLQAISELADSSTQFYRWEGNRCEIFQRGTRKTNVDLRKEEINSSVGIEDVYTAVEVYGRDGVTSGLVEADNPPDFVDRDKELRDPDILTDSDAQRRAVSFLRNNSSVEYEGDITTLPTFAPVGEEIDGSLFDHGQDMVIETVRYGRTRSSISLGFTQRLSRKIRGLDDETTSLIRTQTTTV